MLRKLLIIAGLVLAVALALHLGMPEWKARRANISEQHLRLAAMASPTAGDRILVLAPHCDDESLACAGLIAKALKARAQVRVVLLTNGDGFHYAAERLFGEVSVPPADFLKLARDRQEESLSALAVIGLPRDQVTFLGYPDGGTAQMWLSHWEPSHSYTSPHTDDDRNPYSNTLSPWAPYCGRAVIEDLKTVVRDFRPTTVFCPHPNDQHPDHWALHCYTLAAMHELGMLHEVGLKLYLVHRGDWPVPQGLHLASALTPPLTLADIGTEWGSLPLDEAITERKHEAILKYHSQVLVMRRFLVSFARKNELFGELPTGHLARTDRGKLLASGDIDKWRAVEPSILDPAQDVLQADISPSVDIVAVSVVRDGGRLLLRVDVRGRPSREVVYTAHIHGLTRHSVAPPQTYDISLRGHSPGTTVREAENSLVAPVPLPEGAAPAGLMLSVESRLGTHILDKTAWALLEVD